MQEGVGSFISLQRDGAGKAFSKELKSLRPFIRMGVGMS
jgi:hypothetical protein